MHRSSGNALAAVGLQKSFGVRKKSQIRGSRKISSLFIHPIITEGISPTFIHTLFISFIFLFHISPPCTFAQLATPTFGPTTAAATTTCYGNSNIIVNCMHGYSHTDFVEGRRVRAYTGSAHWPCPQKHGPCLCKSCGISAATTTPTATNRAA